MQGFAIREVEPLDAAVVRAEVPASELADVFDRGYPAVMTAAQAAGARVVGPPFAYYPRPPSDTIEVILGFPVDRRVSPAGEVEPFTLPGGRVASAVHVGHYWSLGETYHRLREWAKGQGLRLSTAMWESYLNDPSSAPPSEWRTEISWPVA